MSRTACGFEARRPGPRAANAAILAALTFSIAISSAFAMTRFLVDEWTGKGHISCTYHVPAAFS
jgi:hypothetical protein